MYTYITVCTVCANAIISNAIGVYAAAVQNMDRRDCETDGITCGPVQATGTVARIDRTENSVSQTFRRGDPRLGSPSRIAVPPHKRTI